MPTINKSKTVYVDFDIDLDDFEDDDIRDEAVSRGILAPSVSSGAGVPPLNSEVRHPLHEIYYAFKFGLNDKATDLARAYVAEVLGVVL